MVIGASSGLGQAEPGIDVVVADEDKECGIRDVAPLPGALAPNRGVFARRTRRTNYPF